MRKLVKSYLNRSQSGIEAGDGPKSQGSPVTKGAGSMPRKSENPPLLLAFKSATYQKLEKSTDNLGPLLENSLETSDSQSMKKQKKFKWLIRVNSRLRIRWDLFVMILSIWNCYFLPFDVAFSSEYIDSLYF